MLLIKDLRKRMREVPEIAKMILPSTKDEIFLDLTGNGLADFGFLSMANAGAMDTFAIELGGDGDFDCFFTDTDNNGIADDVTYYRDGSDTPAAIFKGEGVEAFLGDTTKALVQAMTELNPETFSSTLLGLKAKLVEYADKFRSNGTVGAFRRLLKADEKTAKLVRPSAKNEIFLDLNGDGLADFAFIDSCRDNNLDTFAISTKNDGEFDLYLIDTDKNGLPDHVKYYADGADEPTEGGGSVRLEEALKPATEKFAATLTAKFDAENLIAALNTYKDELIAVLETFRK